MLKCFINAAVLTSSLIVCCTVYAQTNKAPCSSFQKLANGKWKAVSLVKIENGNTSAMISPGTTIERGTRVAGADVYAALQQSCH
jgi:hypothetical protein